MSPRQAHQLGCFGDNVRALRVAGSFDDCQRMVKQALSRSRAATAGAAELGQQHQPRPPAAADGLLRAGLAAALAAPCDSARVSSFRPATSATRWPRSWPAPAACRSARSRWRPMPIACCPNSLPVPTTAARQRRDPGQCHGCRRAEQFRTPALALSGCRRHCAQRSQCTRSTTTKSARPSSPATNASAKCSARIPPARRACSKRCGQDGASGPLRDRRDRASGQVRADRRTAARAGPWRRRPPGRPARPPGQRRTAEPRPGAASRASHRGQRVTGAHPDQGPFSAPAARSTAATPAARQGPGLVPA